MSKDTLLYKNKIEIFVNKHIKKVLNITPTNVTIQGKKCVLQILYNGMVLIQKRPNGKPTCKTFKFSEAEVEKYL